MRQTFRLCLMAVPLTLTWVVLASQYARADVDPVPLLQQALRTRVTIHHNRRSGFMVPAYHCKRASEGCDARMREFARYLSDAGNRYEIDPWLLAAMAFKESGLNPYAVGAVGELGILQLHPKNRRSKGVRFVHDAAYRQHCKREAGACQREVVERAAQLLAKSLEKCEGDMKQALGMYNSGHCNAKSPYIARVLGERAKLMRVVGMDGMTDSPIAAVSPSSFDLTD
jgi:Transglycosylase SLT domain